VRILALLAVFAGGVAAEPPRLVVTIVVDQLSPATVARHRGELRGGLARLLRDGRRFACVHDHAGTETAPGHAAILTGCRPARTGIVLNRWYDPRTLRPVYCVEDPAAGRSPRNLLRDALGDWMKRADPRSRVVAVSAKDRSAILLGGFHADAVFWLDSGAGGIATSAYYFPAGPPDWVAAFDRDGWFEALPESWTYEPSAAAGPDDDPRESDRWSRTSPHPLGAATRERTIANLVRTPYLDAWTLRLARAALARYDLGRGPAPDLLGLSLSAVDTVGHRYGPESQEIRDTVLRLDEGLGELLALLDARGAPYLVALTSDHGVLPFSRMRRVPAAPALREIERRAGVKSLFASGWFYVEGSGGAGAAALAAALRERDDVEAVFSRAELEGAGRGAMLDLCRSSYRRDRSGDLVAVFREGVLLSSGDTGTSHGSLWRYDREVPLVFFGAGVTPGEGPGEARTIDIGPTLARALGVAAPGDVEGSPLDLAGGR